MTTSSFSLPRRRFRAARIANFTVLALVALGGPALAQWQKNQYQQEKAWAEQYRPTPLRAPRVASGNIEVLRIRFYAEEAYRSAGPNWQERMKGELGALNQIVEPAFAVRFEAESFHRWERTGNGQTVTAILEELEKRDPGNDVDWVVGLASPLPLVAMSFHDLGCARMLGKHFVLRGMSSIAEMDEFTRNFPTLDRNDREKFYAERKSHKEQSVFLHEWAHTLGGLHVENPIRLMSPLYSNRTSVFSDADAGLVAAGLASRRTGRDGSPIDWAQLREFVLSTGGADWRTEDRRALLALIEQGPNRAQPAGKTAPTPSETPAAAAAPKPPVAAAAPPSALAIEIRKSMSDGAADKALASLRAAAEKATTPEAATEVARLAIEIGALSDAEHVASNSKAPVQITEEITHARRAFGLPAAAARFHIGPDDEPTYVSLITKARAEMDKRMIGSARTSVGTGLKRFPGAPGLLLVSCALDAADASVKPQRAIGTCDKAIAAMPDLAEALYIRGRLQAESGKSEAALASLRRAVELDLGNQAAWQALAEVYRALGRSAEFRTFSIEHSAPTAH